MKSFKQVDGDLIELALKGEFDVIAQGCNCFCTQKSGIAKQMVATFHTDNASIYPLEKKTAQFIGNPNKLGQIQAHYDELNKLYVCNCYTQYKYGYETGKVYLDYEALTLCMRKLNMIFKGKHIGLPLIGGGLAGGNCTRIITIMKTELVDCDVTLVNYVKP